MANDSTDRLSMYFLEIFPKCKDTAYLPDLLDRKVKNSFPFHLSQLTELLKKSSPNLCILLCLVINGPVIQPFSVA